MRPKRINGIWYLTIKEDILKQLCGISCPVCKSGMLIGDVNEFDPTPAIYCSVCNLRIACHLIILSGCDKETCPVKDDPVPLSTRWLKRLVVAYL